MGKRAGNSRWWPFIDVESEVEMPPKMVKNVVEIYVQPTITVIAHI